ncbi:MAG: hypothetical protein LBG46_07160, partial [Elusimicrobiota bacterium]|nr:hypothetical protein [Elusimicrobiota bacterium]
EKNGGEEKSKKGREKTGQEKSGEEKKIVFRKLSRPEFVPGGSKQFRGKKMAKTKTLSKAKQTSYEAQGDKRFYFCNGQIVSNLNELPGVLRSIDDGTYGYHVNSAKNDISTWVSNVFLKGDLSLKISRAKNRSNMADVIEKALR